MSHVKTQINSPFKEKVIQIIRSIPQGKVASYGQIAAYAGLPRSAREVGWILRSSKENMPWWRVINNKGVISIDGNMNADKVLQKKLLINEGIEFENEFALSLVKYRYKPTEVKLKTFHLDKKYIDNLMQKFFI